MASKIGIKRSGINYAILMIFPALIFLFIFFLFPLVRVIFQSFSKVGFSLYHYGRIFLNPLYGKVILNTFKISFSVAILCLLLGYPVAYLLANSRPKTTKILLLIILVPFWTSLLVRTFAWMVLLQRTGIINQNLMKLGIIDEPLNMIYNFIGANIGMTYILLPFMIFPVYSIMKKIDVNLINAARNLGANPFKTFLKIYLPLTYPGIAAGFLLVLVLALGYFITPALLGGNKEMMIAMLIEQQVNAIGNWEFASALGITLLVIVLVILYFLNRLVKMEDFMGR